MIHLQDVRFAYPGGPEVVGVDDLRIPSGLTLLLGPNGVGKSTLLRLVAGVERPPRGAITILERDLWRDEVKARSHLAYVPEQPELTPYATISEILRLVCRLRGVSERRGEAATRRVGLSRDASRSVRQLSQGQRRRAVLAAAMIGEPSVLLLDEPFEALDREMRDHVVIWIRDAVSAGRGVVVATHEFDEIVDVVGAALSIGGGTVRLHEVPQDLAKRASLLDALARGGPSHPSP